MSTRIAYLINQYPKVSHSFIRREILALERQGFDIQRIALRGWDGALVDKEDLQERARTRYAMRAGVIALPWALLRMLATSPLRFFSALALAVRTGWRAERPLPYHLGLLRRSVPDTAVDAVFRRDPPACAFRDQFDGGRDAGARARRAALQLHRAWP